MSNPTLKPTKRTPSPLQSVLDAISLRSVFGLTLEERMDRLRLIEAARAQTGPEADPLLSQELLARRTETILALVTHPSPNIDAFVAKSDLIGSEITFPGTPQGEYVLLSVAVWSALITDGKDVGAVLAMVSGPTDTADPENPANKPQKQTH